MSDLNEVLRTLSARGVKLAADGENLRYEAPPGAIDHDLLAGLRRHKAALLMLLTNSIAPDAVGLVRSELPERRVLSMQQEALWLAERIDGGTSQHLSLAVRFAQVIDATRLQVAMRRVLERHEELCSRFVGEGARWHRVTGAAADFELVIRSWPRPLVQDDSELQQQLQEFVDAPFDLEQGGALRACLLTALGESLLCLVVHHTAADGVAIGILLKELTALYDGDENATEERGAPTLRYADYAAWQRSDVQQRRLDRQAGEYAAALGDLPRLHSIPTDRPRLAGGCVRGQRLVRHVPSDRIFQLTRFAATHGATLFTAMQSLFSAFVSRLSNEAIIVIATPVVNRETVELERIVGSFTNMLVLRVDVSHDDSFATLLTRVRETNELALGFQSVTPELLQARMAGRGPTSHQSIYQLVLAMQPAIPRLLLAGVEGTIWELERSMAHHDLGLDLTPQNDGYRLRWEYNAELFDAATIERFARTFEDLLDRAAAAPYVPLAELLVKNEEPFSGRPMLQSVPLENRFDAITAAHPQRLALTCGGQTLDYADLQQRGRRLAHWMRRQGVRFGDNVVISTTPCLDTYVAILAATMSGAAYMPIDPAYPFERIAAMLEDAKPRLALGCAALLDAMPTGIGAVPVHAYADAIAASTQELPAPLDPPNVATRPAYIVFTSGSTGRPKGVVVPHAGVARLAGAAPWLKLEPGQTCLQAAPLSFDAATFELWNTWLQGGHVIVVDRDTILSPSVLGTYVREHRIDVAFFTTAYFNRLAAIAPDVLGGLDTVLFGGEAVNNALVARVLETCPSKRFVHVYGPTENTTFSTGHLVETAEAKGDRPIPIGRASCGDYAYVLDEALRPLPIGAVGELYLGGNGLAIGYLAKPRETALAFVPDVGARTPGARLYRTGDLVRCLPSGELEFVGRRDAQVKINGYRIELKEIETMMMRHVPGIQGCAASVQTDELGNKRICCYIVVLSPPETDIEQLITPALMRLPAYARPHRTWRIDEFPLNANGKIDWARLPEPFSTDTSQPAVGEWSALERDVADVWLRVAGVRAPSPNADFFVHGGDSLRGMAVWHELQKRWNVHLRLKDFLSNPTVAAAAGLIGQAQAESAVEVLHEIDL